MSSLPQYKVIVPAAGIGQRMLADRPKQYLTIAGKTILEHTLENLYAHPQIKHVIVVLNAKDDYFASLPLASKSWITRVDGGNERADSVLAGLDSMNNEKWVLVHDAARPCLDHDDLSKLLLVAQRSAYGAILACRVRDTMKRANDLQEITHTESRDNLWHALTPQFFPLVQLRDALHKAARSQVKITDEASAIEWAQGTVHLVEGRGSNIKVTQPEDLQLAEFYLQHKAAL
tara:strand:- start:179 stop:874 length:696 start_codon:yes stop_codon:yes gene_type:complete